MTTILRAPVTAGLPAAPPPPVEVRETPSDSLAPDTYARPHQVVLLGAHNLREAVRAAQRRLRTHPYIRAHPRPRRTAHRTAPAEKKPLRNLYRLFVGLRFAGDR
ncbi:hypothetical protein GCM10020227_08890 [Streptomyces flavovirens]